MITIIISAIISFLVRYLVRLCEELSIIIMIVGTFLGVLLALYLPSYTEWVETGRYSIKGLEDNIVNSSTYVFGTGRSKAEKEYYFYVELYPGGPYMLKSVESSRVAIYYTNDEPYMVEYTYVREKVWQRYFSISINEGTFVYRIYIPKGTIKENNLDSQ